METIGKILSITLLTIFGSAAATVYVVDSNYLKSFLGSSPATYTSDEVLYSETEDSTDFREYREEHTKKYTAVQKNNDSTSYDSEKKPVWGQEYSTDTDLTEYKNRRASNLAQNNTLGSLIKNMDYWSERYRQASEAGESRSANLAYKNYRDYKKAVEIKRLKAD